MKRWQKVIESTYAKVFSDSNQKRIEFATLWLSLIGFVVHLEYIGAPTNIVEKLYHKEFKFE